MTKNLNNELKTYYRQINRLLSCKGGEKKAITDRIRSDIGCYIEENPNVTFEDINKKFGSPEQIAEQFYSTDLEEKLAKKLSSGKKIALVAALIAVVVLAALIGIVIMQWKNRVVYDQRVVEIYASQSDSSYKSQSDSVI